MKILVVDDERAIRNSLKEILGDEGYDVDVAEDGAIAVQMVEKEKYNIIFCDIKMPNMDGMEVLDHPEHVFPLPTCPPVSVPRMHCFVSD